MKIVLINRFLLLLYFFSNYQIKFGEASVEEKTVFRIV